MDEKRVKEVFADEAFVKSLLKMDSPADVQAALKGKGLDVTQDELVKIRDHLLAAANKDGDLDEEQLKEVAGGSIGTIVKLGIQLLPDLIEGVNGAVRNRW